MNLDVEWQGVLTNQTPLIHGGESLGTVQYLKRSRFFSADGTLMDIPVISGNAIRGALRDFSASKFHAFLGQPKLTLAQSHLLWAGGSISKARRLPLSGERLRTLRNAIPHIGLFGGSAAGRVISGALTVHTALPLCKELQHLLPADFQSNNSPSYWDIVQLDEYSRFPDNQEDEESQTLLMRYGVESFIPGTRFFWRTGVQARNEIEVSYFNDLLEDFLTQGLQVGGNKARGYGVLKGQPFTPDPSSLSPSEAKAPRWEDQLSQQFTIEEIMSSFKEVQ